MKCPRCKKSLAFEPDELSAQERKLFEYLHSYFKKNKTYPLWREMGEHLGVVSPASIGPMFVRLQQKDFVQKTGHRQGYKLLKKSNRKRLRPEEPKGMAMDFKSFMKCPHCKRIMNPRPFNLTEIEWTLLRLLITYSHKYQTAPGYAKMMCVTDMSSTSNIHKIMISLERNLYIKTMRGGRRILIY